MWLHSRPEFLDVGCLVVLRSVLSALKIASARNVGIQQSMSMGLSLLRGTALLACSMKARGQIPTRIALSNPAVCDYACPFRLTRATVLAESRNVKLRWLTAYSLWGDWSEANYQSRIAADVLTKRCFDLVCWHQNYTICASAYLSDGSSKRRLGGIHPRHDDTTFRRCFSRS